MRIKSSVKTYRNTWWMVNDQKFSTTKEMITSLPKDSYKASYHTRITREEQGMGVAESAGLGALAGVGLLGLGVVAANSAGPAMRLFTMGFSGPAETVTLGVAALAIGAGAGAGLGAVHALIGKIPDVTKTVERGTVDLLTSGKSTFYRDNNMKKGIDLSYYR